MVIFEEKKEKDQVWSKLRDNPKTKTNIVVTQDSSTKRQVAINEMERTAQSSRALHKTSKKMAIVKPNTQRNGSPLKKVSLSCMGCMTLLIITSFDY